ncbi:hypothetical protein FACS1894139_07620 [Planctomycetales bacterium]|nr:hypothetical protein FACS1894108_09040 [Planctomycetales bacterium]GHT04831.1 hypothetical protein FACS1894139_07620 [Planctomycetales bacterium]
MSDIRIVECYRQFAEDNWFGFVRRQLHAAPWYCGSLALHFLVLLFLIAFLPETRAFVRHVIHIDPQIPLEESLPETEIAASLKDFIADPDADDAPPKAEPLLAPLLDLSAPADDTGWDWAEPLATGTRGGGEPLTPTLILPSRENSRADSARQKRGGTARGAQALANGLAWLAKTQEDDGGWNTYKYAGRGNDLAATALAWRALRGGGADYRAAAAAAQDFLLKQGDALNNLPPRELALTAWAFAEARRPNDDALGARLQELLDLGRKTQLNNGGWSEKIGDKTADTLTTGLWVGALTAARAAALRLGAGFDRRVLDYAAGYWRGALRPEKDNAQLLYVAFDKGAPDRAASALALAGLVALESREWRGLAEEFIAKQWLPGEANADDSFIGWYGLAEGMLAAGGKYWDALKKTLEAATVHAQSDGGFYRGAWSPNAGAPLFETTLGKVGATALGCLLLEIYEP